MQDKGKFIVIWSREFLRPAKQEKKAARLDCSLHIRAEDT